MLQKMNEVIKGWVAGVIIAIIGATFVMWGVSSYIGSSKGAQATVAKVNGYKITEQMFSGQFRQLKNGYLQQAGLSSLPAESTDQLKQYVLQRMIEQQLLLQQADRAHFAVSPQQVQALLMQDPALQVNGKFSRQRLRAAMYQSGASNLNEFYSNIHQEVLINQVSAGIDLSSFVLPAELNQAYGLMHQERHIGYFKLPLSMFSSKVKVSSEDIKKDYEINQDRYMAPMQASFDYILLDPKEVSKSINVSDKLIKQYYQDHLSNYVSTNRWQVTVFKLSPGDTEKQTSQQLMARAQRFLKLARTTKNVAKLASDNGFVSSQQWLQASNPLVSDEELRKMDVGSLSSPIVNKDGVVVLKLDKFQAAKTQSIDSVRQQIVGLLTSQQLEQVMSRDTEQLSQISYTDPDSLAPAAKALQLPILTSKMMPKSGLESGLFSDATVLQAAFGDEVIQQGYNSSPVALKDGSILVLRRRQVIESHQLPLSEVKDQIQTKLTKQRIEELAGVKAYSLKKALGSGQSTAKLAQDNGLSWKEVAALSRDSQEVPKDLVHAVFNASIKKNQITTGSALVDDAYYYVYKIYGFKNPLDSVSNKADLKALKEQLVKAQSQIDYAAYTNSVREKASIKIYQDALAEVQ